MSFKAPVGTRGKKEGRTDSGGKAPPTSGLRRSGKWCAHDGLDKIRKRPSGSSEKKEANSVVLTPESGESRFQHSKLWGRRQIPEHHPCAGLPHPHQHPAVCRDQVKRHVLSP